MKTLPHRLRTFWNQLSERKDSKPSPTTQTLAVEVLENRLPLASFTATVFTDGGAGSLRDAIDQANLDTNSDEDEIVLQAGTYELSGSAGDDDNQSGDLDIRRDTAGGRLVIRGAGADQTFIDANFLDRVFDIFPDESGPIDVEIRDLTIIDGVATDSGFSGFGDTSYVAGGGILAYNTNLTLTRVHVIGNVAQGTDGGEDIQDAWGGGIALIGSSLTGIDIRVAENEARGADALEVSGEGRDGRDGGDAYGGGIYYDPSFAGENATFSLQGSTLALNKAIGGDGSDGTEGSYGGGTDGGEGGWGGTGGDASGGGLYMLTTESPSEIIESTLEENLAEAGSGGNGGKGGDADPGYGGGSGGAGGDGGSAFGGGLSLGYEGFGELNLVRSTLYLNSASGGDAGVGGSRGLSPTSNGSFGPDGDPGDAFGGGGFITGSARFVPVNSTISSNSVTSGNLQGGYGGAVAGGGLAYDGEEGEEGRDSSFEPPSFSDGVEFSGNYTIYNSTIAYNQLNASGFEAAGGGVAILARDDVSIELLSTIVSENTGAISSASDDVGNGEFGLSSSWVGTEETAPLLLDATIAFNDGPTQTHALEPGSPAINAGTDQIGLATDQRGTGFPRTIGLETDIGAYEVDLPPLILDLQRGNSPIMEGLEDGEVFLTVENLSFYGPVSVELSFSGTAGLDLDYYPDGFDVDGSSIFVEVTPPEVPGLTEVIIDLSVFDDDFPEDTESIVVTMEAVYVESEVLIPFTGPFTFENNEVTIEIIDNDEPVIVDLSRGPSPIREGLDDGQVFLTVENLDNEVGIVVELSFSGTATLGTDYLPDGYDVFGDSIFVEIPANGSVYVEEIQLITFNDTIFENSESVVVAIAGVFENFSQQTFFVAAFNERGPEQEQERPRLPEFEGSIEVDQEPVIIDIVDVIDPEIPPTGPPTGGSDPINRVPVFAPPEPDPVPLPPAPRLAPAVEVFGNQINLSILEKTTISVYRVENVDGQPQLQLIRTVSLAGQGSLGPTALLNDQPPGLYRITAELEQAEFVVWQGNFPTNLLEALNELGEMVQVLVNERSDPLAHLRELLPSAEETPLPEEKEEEDDSSEKSEENQAEQDEQTSLLRPSSRFESEIAWVAQQRSREALWEELDRRGELGSMFDAYYSQQDDLDPSLGDSE